ncbi:DEAD/DEAH box helicase [Krasilnikovia sp. M28-CT-15]|uniref:DEAD/DEAH box helicase n=1 Tax=Krasilnikovia sp. M28-CT-15 TaxID=3373540 RepID=UPI003876FFBC
MIIEYDETLVEQVAHMLDMRLPNQQALDALARALDTSVPGSEFIADLATGVGKTYIAGGLLDYLYLSGVRNVVIVTPGSTILRKTIDNLTPGHRKYLRGLQSNPLVITLDSLERGEVGAALEDENRFKVFVFTVQSLLRPDSAEARRAHRPHETLGQALYTYLTACEDLVVVADEHHIYYSGNAKKFQAAIDDMRPMALVGLTATPHPSTLDKRVYHYPLSGAIADGYVKIPVLVSRSDGIKDKRTQLADGLTLLDAKREAMRAYCRQTHKSYSEPIFFLVTSDIDEANEYVDMLAGQDMLGERSQILLVTCEEPDKALSKLDTLENPDSNIRAVVSVSMLKEGWDVKNIYVISSVRSMESQLLTEQILGRGLRLPFGSRTGNPMLDAVEVLSHNSFSALLRQARVLLEETLGDRVDEAEVVVNQPRGRHVSGVPIQQGGELPQGDYSQAESVDIRLPRPAAIDHDQVALFELGEPTDAPAATHTSLSLATLGSRVATARETSAILSRTLTAREPGGVRVPLFLPTVVLSWHRDPFSLGQVNLDSVESLGRMFADDNAPTLTRKALDAERDEMGQTRVVIHDAAGTVIATQLRIAFDSIETDLVSRLMATNAVEATVAEMNAAIAVARAFLHGAGITEETPWRAEHGRLATTRLVEWINTQRTSSPAREVRSVELVRWPEPPTRVEARPPADRHIVTKRADFERWYPYAGWEKAVYEINDFDAYSTEFLLATLFERDGAVKAWVRIEETVPIRITYLMGAVQKIYEPDFIVIDSEGIHWIVEGKADSEMTSQTVLAKRDAARAWVSTVNAEEIVHQRWGYLLASESVIASASTWGGLKAGGQVFQ